MLSHHQTRRGWNAFFRIRLALTLEPYFQQRALENMRAGGKYKGLANLPEAQHIDVRQEIASAAGVGARNVSNVKTILKNAHPRLKAALRNGTLTINGAMQFCKLPKAEQLEQFIRHSEEREINKVIRQSIAQPKEKRPAPTLRSTRRLAAAGGATARIGCGRSVGLNARLFLSVRICYVGPYSQKELNLHEIPRSSQADSVSDALPYWDRDEMPVPQFAGPSVRRCSAVLPS
jgi:hypothetical protein